MKARGTTTQRRHFEEVWEGQETDEGGVRRWKWRRGLTLEEELLSLQVLAPDLVEDAQTIFKEAVSDTLANVLTEDEAIALIILLGGVDLGSPREVYEALDSILHRGSGIIKSALAEEFRISVHLLLEKLERGMILDPESRSIQVSALPRRH